MEKFEPPGFRGTWLNEPGKSWPLPPDMEPREEEAFDPVSAACTTTRSDGNIVARAIAIEVDCAPTCSAEEVNVSRWKWQVSTNKHLQSGGRDHQSQNEISELRNEQSARSWQKEKRGRGQFG